MSELHVVEPAKLRSLIRNLFTSAGTTEEEAEILSDSLVYANLTGVDSHGVVRVRVYLERLEKGLVSKRPVPKWITHTGAISVLDADNGWGQSAALLAMEKAVQLARQHGIGLVSVRNSNHIGACAYWTKIAARAHCIGFASTNSAAIVAAAGTCKPTLGTNPLSIAVPTCGDESTPPIVLDMATSEVARGKIIVAAKSGKNIPPGWALDVDGHPTTDATRAMFGSLLPFGGVKGSGLSMMLDILTGILSGARFGTQVGDLYGDTEQGLGSIFGAIDVRAFMDESEFYERMRERIQMTKMAVKVDDEEAFMPGEPEERTRIARSQTGIPLDEATLQDLRELSQKYQIPCDI